MEIDFLVVDAEPSVHRPTQTRGVRVQPSQLYYLLPVLGLQNKLEIDDVGVPEDRLGSEIALIEHFLDLKQRVHSFVETTGALVLLTSVGSGGQTDMHKQITFEAPLSFLIFVATNADQDLGLVGDVLYDGVGLFFGCEVVQLELALTACDLHIVYIRLSIIRY